MRVLYLIAAVLIVLTTSGCQSETSKIDLDTAVRKDLKPEQWASIDNSFKFNLCLRYKIGEMRRMVRGVSGPNALIEYYPVWQEGLEDCEKLYKIDHKQAELLREAVATEIAKVLGEEASSYLNMQRLYRDHRSESEWIDMWRSLAIVGVAEVENNFNKQQ